MILILLFAAHLIGDFVFQTSKIVIEKQNNFSKLIKHSIIYAIPFGLILGFSSNLYSGIMPFLIIIITHFIIDWIRVIIEKNVNHQYKLLAFLFDQVFHFSIIVFVYFIFNISIDLGSLLALLISKFGLQGVNNAIIYSIIYMIMIQPSAVVVKKVLNHISIEKLSTEKNTELSQTINAGYLIGVLERLIIVTLVLVGQIPTIGFVLAAKSIARFKQLDDKKFSEMYLVGTLLSVAISIIITLILKNMLL